MQAISQFLRTTILGGILFLTPIVVLALRLIPLTRPLTIGGPSTPR
jgi:hypothetical protein